MSTDANAIWNECLSFIKDNIQPQAFKTWFEPIKPVKLADNSLSVQVPSKFFYEWLEEHYVKLLKVALTKSLGEGAKLVYIIRMENTYGNSLQELISRAIIYHEHAKFVWLFFYYEKNRENLSKSRNPIYIE